MPVAITSAVCARAVGTVVVLSSVEPVIVDLFGVAVSAGIVVLLAVLLVLVVVCAVVGVVVKLLSHLVAAAAVLPQVTAPSLPSSPSALVGVVIAVGPAKASNLFHARA